jgi:trk system potassium uptake protein TrkA
MRIIIVGCGRMGAGLALTLTQRGHDVTVIDRDPTAFATLGERFSGRIITGHGFDREVLRCAGITRADALAAVTSSDETNVVTARVARQFFRVPRVVARLYDPRKAEIYRRLGVLTISTTEWGVHRITELLSYSWFEPIVSLGSSVDIVDVEAPPALVGRSLASLTVPGEVHPVAISRGGRCFLPTQETRLQAGDLLHIAVLATSTERLKGLLGV